MEDEMKRYFKQALMYSDTVTRIAATGGSGAGKTTSTLELIDRFASQFIYSNIGAIQSSKIRTVIIPVCLEENKKRNAFFAIHFMKYSEIELVKNAFHNVLSEKLMRAYRNYEIEDAEDIVEKILAPENKMYDISAYCNEDRKTCLTEAVDKVCVSLIEGNEDFLPLIDVIKKQKARVEQQGKKFDLRSTMEQELARRLGDSKLVDLNSVYNEIIGITDEMKSSIWDKLQTFCNNGLEMEFIKKDEIRVYNDEIRVYIDESENSCNLANELFSFMYKKDGKDLVVSHLTLIAEMSKSVKTVFFDSGIFKRTNLPLFKIYDLKGLEAGKESIDETLIKLRESLPDAILAYHRTNDIKDYFVSYLNRIQTEFKKVPVTIFLTHADETMKAYVRNALNGFGAREDNEYYEEQVRVAYERLKEENKLFNEKTSKDLIFCSMINECEKIDEVLEDEKKLYQENRMAEIIAGICKEQDEYYKKESRVDEEMAKKIHLSFNEEKLLNIVNKIVIGNKTHAASNYFNQRNLHPHWNTIYKWRSMHRGGSGWTSNAQVYDNISIYISNFVSGFINKAELADAIEITVSSDVLLELEQSIKEKLKVNIQKNLELNYWGFFYSLKKALTYDGLAEEFNRTHFSSALDLLNTKLSDVDYVKKTMNQVLEDYAKNFKALTFRCVLDNQKNEQK